MPADEWKLGLSEGAYDLKSFQVFEGKTDCSLCHVGISNPKQLLGRSQHARGWAQAQSAAEPNSNHFHTKSQRSVFKGEREKETAAAVRERRREAVARGGRWRETGSGRTGRERERRTEPAELEGEKGRREAGEPGTRQRFMGREGSMAAPRWPAGRPLGSCYTARAAAAAHPRRRARAARRGPRGHDSARGRPGVPRPAPAGGPARGQGSDAWKGGGLSHA